VPEITIFELALSRLPGIGNVLGRQLISYCGSAEQVFKAKRGTLLKIPGIGEQLADQIIRQDIFKDTEHEISRAQKDGTNLLFFTNSQYPARLLSLTEAPLVLYSKGKVDFNNLRSIALVGTRSASNYGIEVTEEIIKALKPYSPLIVSGLAYGIDIAAHKASIYEGVPTVAVMGNGMDAIYPAIHRKYVSSIINNGALLTEYGFGIKAEAFHFPARNRIIAGLSDIVIVVEAKNSGGALITAEIADQFNREIMAVPGRVMDKTSEGCNKLIKDLKAHIYTTPSDIIQLLNWDIEKNSNKTSRKIVAQDLDAEELLIYNLLFSKGEQHIDEVSFQTLIPINKIASLILGLEFKGLVKALPGKKFKLT
jgi:DNA processing protein